MSASSDRPGITITETGVEAPDASVIRQYGVASYKGTFGQDLDTSPYTPQGQRIDSETAIIHDKNSQLIEVLNQFDPEKNDGIWQEGIGKIYFITRKSGFRTTVPCEITGIVGTMIPAGEAQAVDKNGHLYALSQDTFITTPSPVPVTFVALEEGPIVCPKESLDRIYKRVNGWDTVINPTAGVTGSWPEGRLAFERRRYDSVAKNGHGNVSAMWGAIADLDNVLSVQIAENVTNVMKVIRGVQVDGHSVFISVVGGDPQQIATTIYERKDGGCGMEGNTPVTILIPTRNSEAVQKKIITYNIPKNISCGVKVNIASNPYMPADVEDEIRNAIIANWNGLDVLGDRVEIGEVLLASRFYCPINDLRSDQFDLLKLKVGRVPSNYPASAISWEDSIGTTLDEYPVISPEHIFIVHGPDADVSDANFFHYDGAISGTRLNSTYSGGDSTFFQANLDNSGTVMKDEVTPPEDNKNGD